MALFEPAFEILLKQEGGYSDSPYDPGKKTKYGISQRAYPSLDIKNLTIEQAKEIYQKEYWQEAFEEIKSQEIVNKVFTVGVDIGMTHANICLQRAVRAVNGTKLIEDGILGTTSIQIVNQLSPVPLIAEPLLASLRSELAAYYRMINNPHYLDGWLNRAYA